MSGIIVGYYCDHRDEPLGERTHLRDNAHGKKALGSPQPETVQALTFGTYDYRTGKYGPPPCPRAVPLRVTRARLLAVAS